MHVVIRADGGPDIGYGHLVRTGSLAERLLEDGHRVTYATTTPEHVARVCPTGVDRLELSSRSIPGPLLNRIDEVDAVVVDSYLADAEYQHAIADRTTLAVIDDDARHPIRADLLINGNLYAPDLNYEIRGEAPRRCLGPDYLLLRESITRLADRDPPWHDTPERAIVTMGGSDMADLTPRVVRAFDGLGLRVDAIVGPGFSDDQERRVREVADEISASVDVVRDPEDLPERMFRSDLGVSTSSTTTYELLTLGTPIVSRPVADNQQPIATALRERDVATVLDRRDSQDAFRSAITEYVESPELRRERRRRGREIVDGRGTERVYEELLTVAGETPGS